MLLRMRHDLIRLFCKILHRIVADKFQASTQTKFSTYDLKIIISNVTANKQIICIYIYAYIYIYDQFILTAATYADDFEQTHNFISLSRETTRTQSIILIYDRCTRLVYTAGIYCLYSLKIL